MGLGRSHHDAQARGIDRSRVEFGLAKELLKRGLSPSEALAWFCHYQPSRHAQEVLRRGNTSWTESLISTAQAALQQDLDTPTAPPGGSGVDGIPGTPPSYVDGTLHQPAKRAWVAADARVVLEALVAVESCTYTALWQRICQVTGRSTRAAKGDITLAQEFGLIERVGRGRYRITELGRRQLDAEGLDRGPERLAWREYVGTRPRRYLRRQQDAPARRADRRAEGDTG